MIPGSTSNRSLAMPMFVPSMKAMMQVVGSSRWRKVLRLMAARCSRFAAGEGVLKPGCSVWFGLVFDAKGTERGGLNEDGQRVFCTLLEGSHQSGR